MSRITPAMRRVLFEFSGGDRLHGCDDENAARRLHLALTSFLCWIAFMEFLVIPLFSARKVAMESLALVLGGATAGALALVRRGRKRAAALLFLSVLWCLQEVYCALSGGIHSSGLYLALVVVFAAALLLGIPAALRFAAVTLLLSLAEALLEYTGHPLPVYFPGAPLSLWATDVGIAALTIGVAASLLDAYRAQISALRESKDRIEEAQQTAHLGSFTEDPITGRMEWSDELYRIYELDPAQRPSREVVLARAHPDDRALIQRTREDLIRLNGRFDFEHRLLMPDGRIKFLLVTGTVKSGADGRPQTRGTVQDITERKRAGEEKAKLEAQLHQEHKMESIGRLAGGVAHDFNNLLTVINSYSDVLMHQLDSPQREFAEQINKAGESAASLTRQLLAFSRMEATHPETVHLNDIVAESGNMLERIVGERIEMKTSLEASPDKALADPNQIRQCLVNLVVNARDAMPAGGQLTIETGNVEVAPGDLPIGSGGTPGPHVRLTVRDSGTGMDEETGRRIFEPFFTTKGTGRGTGLGLSTVYGIVRRWRGFLMVGSVPGRGSEFSIYLPLSVAIDPMRKAPAAENLAPPAISETVLVVDDHEMVRQCIVQSLRMYGYEVLEARDGAEALQAIERNGDRIHLMLTDVMMPDMGGRELAALANAVCPSMSVLFMTGYAHGSINDVKGPDGRDEVIMKPFVPKAMLDRVRALLQRRAGNVDRTDLPTSIARQGLDNEDSDLSGKGSADARDSR